MNNNYQFLDAFGSILTAASSVINGAQQPIVQIGGSVITIGTAVPNQSVSGTIGASIIGLVPIVGSVSGSVGIVGNPSISGTVNIGTIPGSVVTFQGGAVISSIMSSNPSSVLVGASIFGQLPGRTATLGSIAVLQGSNPWIETFSNSSILAVPVGSVITAWQSPSIVGTYAEDSGSSNNNKGLLILAVRNDTIASLVNADQDYIAPATDSAGRVLTKPFSAEESRVEGYQSVVSTSVTTLVGAAGAGLRNYITDLWFANTGSVATLITLKDGAGSVLGFTIAPAGSGSNLPGLQMPIRTGANSSFDFQPAIANSVLYATVKGFKAP